nr:MAG TPA: hypothetical protein [Bacteriophage sp.]
MYNRIETLRMIANRHYMKKILHNGLISIRFLNPASSLTSLHAKDLSVIII